MNGTRVVLGALLIVSLQSSIVAAEMTLPYALPTPPPLEAWQVPPIDSQLFRVLSPRVVILPSISESYLYSTLGKGDDQKLTGVGSPLLDLICRAYGHDPAYVNVPKDFPRRIVVDYFANLPTGSRTELQKLIRKQFGYSAKRVKKDVVVYYLQLDHRDAPGLKEADSREDQVAGVGGGVIGRGVEIPQLAGYLEMWVNTHVFDKTGLYGPYNFELKLNPISSGKNPSIGREDLQKALKDQLGLKLVPIRKSFEYLVIEKEDV